VLILGVSCYFHDAAAALLHDGQLVAAAEEQRFTRKKHDYDSPVSHRLCLGAGGITAADLDYLVFFEKPFRKFERLLLTSMQTFPRSMRVFREAMLSWLGDKIWIRNLIQNKLGLPAHKILFSEHHLSHAASCFLCSPFDEAAVLTIDGVGEWTTASIGVGKGTQVRILKEVRFPHSLGLLYSAFTAFLGFDVNEGDYKVMGMAPLGKPNYIDKVCKLIRFNQDGSFELDMDYFSFHHSPEQTYNQEFLDLFGAPRAPESPFYTETSGYPCYFGEKPSNYTALCRQNQDYADIAASIQVVIEEAVLKLARQARAETGCRKLCMAGCVALNSVANGRVLRETDFEDVYIQPAAGDAGGALGAALFGYHAILGQPRRFVMEHAYWGEDHGPEAIEAFLKNNGIRYARSPNQEEIDRTLRREPGPRQGFGMGAGAV
jgi:carbamoyltransferase